MTTQFRTAWAIGAAALLCLFFGISARAQQPASAPTCTSFTYYDWSACVSGWQSRSVASASPAFCGGGNPVLTQPCDTAKCVDSDWQCTPWNDCGIFGNQTRQCTQVRDCAGGLTPVTFQACEAGCDANTGWRCSDWGPCVAGGKRIRSCERCKDSPATTAVTEMSCDYAATGVEPLTERDVVVRRQGGSALYYLAAGGRRYVFPTASVYRTWFKDFSGVIDVTDSQLAGMPLVGNVTYRPGIRMVKITTDPKVYAVAPGGVLRWVVSEAVAKRLYGSDWNRKVDDVPAAFFVNYSFGPEISTPADFDPLTAAQAATSVNDDKQVPHTETPRLSDTAPDTGK